MTTTPAVAIVDDDEAMRDSLTMLLKSEGIPAKSYRSGEEFLQYMPDLNVGCLLLDVRIPGIDGMDLHEHLKKSDFLTPVIIMTGHGDVAMAVRAMKTGAYDFIEKPFDNDKLLDRVKNCINECDRVYDMSSRRNNATSKISTLTRREHEVMQLLVEGDTNKHIANKLGISPRTVELHRAKVMQKLGAKTLPDVVRISLEADSTRNDYSVASSSE